MDLTERTIDSIEQELAGIERLIAKARARQMRLLVEADRRQAATADGCRSLTEWVAGRLDVAPETAATLTRTARSMQDHPKIAAQLQTGDMSFDRIVELVRLAAIDPDAADGGGWEWDVAGLRRSIARRRRVGHTTELNAFDDRHLVMQPALTDAAWKLWGLLPATDGEILDAALAKRADELPNLPDGSRDTLTHRRVDALVAIAADSLDTTTETASAAPLVTLFVDIDRTGGSGAVLDSGMPVGPNALDEVLCDTRVQTIVTQAGQPLASGRTTRTIGPALRRAILHRDGHACAADGCTSRYRLQVHHKVPWSAGGATDPDNLVTLCWYHHHVVVHGMGLEIAADSPPTRLRFVRRAGHDPP